MTRSEPVLAWLQEPDNRSVRYRTLTELLGRDPAESEGVVGLCK